jgi:hypothetical protein
MLKKFYARKTRVDAITRKNRAKNLFATHAIRALHASLRSLRHRIFIIIHSSSAPLMHRAS